VQQNFMPARGAVGRPELAGEVVDSMSRTLPLLLLLLCTACSSYMQNIPPLGPPGPNEVNVVFCRPSRFICKGVEFPLWDGDTLIGFAEDGASVEYRCAPGEHHFVTLAQSYKCVPATLAGGHTYYVWVTPRFGVWTPAVGLTPVRREDTELIADLRASLAKTSYRAPVREECAPYETRRRDRTAAALAKFQNGDYTPEPALRAEDGYREPLAPQP
jgi:hypothetical protein